MDRLLMGRLWMDRLVRFCLVWVMLGWGWLMRVVLWGRWWVLVLGGGVLAGVAGVVSGRRGRSRCGSLRR
ncbi:hypothetical protein, partial [Lentzea flava]|uniref:hypothetical protein n=1 Tax=Lentzea flava TaxID=103732 RepID=UPI0034D6BB93